MKNLFSSFSSLLVAAACALTLGSCNRAEYAMLPKGSSYLGSTRVATPAPAPAPVVASTIAAATAAEAPAATPTPTAAATIKTAPAVVAATPATAVPATSAVAAAPAAAPTTLGSTATISTGNEPIKLTRVQRFAASKALKTLSKASGLTQIKQKLDVAKTTRISGYLRTGIVLLLIALIISLFSRVNSLFGIIATILAIIGLVFIVLWLLDNL